MRTPLVRPVFPPPDEEPDHDDEGGQLLRPGEVGAMFGVSTKTVARWAADGLLSVIFTPGGRRRYRAAEVQALRKVETV